jgi:uncharacterized protein DUF6647
MEADMFRQITLYAALVSFAMVGSSWAQTAGAPNDVQMPPVIEAPPEPAPQARPAERGPALLTEIATWLSVNFDLPAASDHPKVAIVPAMEIAFLRYGAFTAMKQAEVVAFYSSANSRDAGREVVAVYDDKTSTIFLPEGWTGNTPTELSVLVHEMVHHLQKAANLSYECPAAREKLAYAAQEKWLSQYGRNLLEDFEIDSVALLLSTKCGY